MKRNIGKIDKFIRLLFALLFAILAFFYSPYWWILAVILIVTSVCSFCGLYQILGINTIKKKGCEVIKLKEDKVKLEEDKKVNNYTNNEIELNNGSDGEKLENHNNEEIDI